MIDEFSAIATFLSGEEHVILNWIHPQFHPDHSNLTQMTALSESSEAIVSEKFTDQSAADTFYLTVPFFATTVLTLGVVAVSTFYLVTN